VQGHSRRDFLGMSAAAGAVGLFGLSSSANAETAGTHELSTVSAVAGSDSTRKFHVKFPEADLVDLRRRVAAKRWSTKETVSDSRGVSIPVAVTAFPDEIYQAPRSWAEKAYPKLIYYNRPAVGGHFAAWEQPASFSSELRASFKSVR